MKRLITLLFVLTAFATIQAQNIPLINGDCSTNAALTGSSPFVIPGFTITQASSLLDLTNSGITGGKLRIKGPVNGSAQGNVVVITEKVDISSFSNTGVYTFQSTVTSTSGTVGLVNVNVKAYDAGGVLITAANVFVGGTVTKLNSQLINGVAVSHGASVTLQPNSAGGSNASYLTFELQVGKYIANDLYIDDFTLSVGNTAATTTVTPLTGVLTCEAGTGPSSVSPFTVEGAGLTADVVVTPGANLEISTTSGSGFVFAPATITLPQVGGSVSLTTIYARLKAGINTAGILGKGSVSVTISNPTAGKKTVVFTGSVTGVVATIPASDTLMFVKGTGSTLTQRIKVSAYKLTSDVVVNSGSNIEITTDSLFATTAASITLPKDTGAIVGTYIYTRLKSGLAAGKYTDATTKVILSSAGFTSHVQQFVGIVSGTSAISTINSSNYINVYPNPTTDFAQINCADGIDEVSLYSITGSLISKVQVGSTNHRLDISSLVNGIYFISVKNNKGIVNAKINKI